MTSSDWARPPRLEPGAAVAVVAPAGPVPPAPFEAGARILGSRYRLVHSPRIFERTGFLAGEDAARAAELQQALDDPNVRAVFVARGGWGILRLLPPLDASGFVRAPKPIVGFSDVTALHAWTARARIVTLHAPVVTQLSSLPDEDVDALFAALESPEPPPPMVGLRTIAPGRASGRLLGGNLEVLTRLLGTPFALPLDGAVLLLEEVGERPYRIDRALTQLRLLADFAGLRGVVVGDLMRCDEPDGSGPTAAEVVAERLGGLGIPVVAGAPVGHDRRNRALPLGVRVTVDADAGRLELHEAAVQ
jgi:muramoyltetrapeptide carboxypeptidase